MERLFRVSQIRSSNTSVSKNKCQYLPTVHTYCICTQYMLLGSLHGAVFILLEECCPFVLPYKKRAILVPAAVLFN